MTMANVLHHDSAEKDALRDGRRTSGGCRPRLVPHRERDDLARRGTQGHPLGQIYTLCRQPVRDDCAWARRVEHRMRPGQRTGEAQCPLTWSRRVDHRALAKLGAVPKRSKLSCPQPPRSNTPTHGACPDGTASSLSLSVLGRLCLQETADPELGQKKKKRSRGHELEPIADPAPGDEQTVKQKKKKRKHTAPDAELPPVAQPELVLTEEPDAGDAARKKKKRKKDKHTTAASDTSAQATESLAARPYTDVTTFISSLGNQMLHEPGTSVIVCTH
jgi:hypothetical protein